MTPEETALSDTLAKATWPELGELWKAALQEFLENIGVPEHFADVVEIVRSHSLYRSLEADWITLPTRVRQERYARLLEIAERAGYETRPFCMRCGACCMGSSPSLFDDDLRLFTEGLLRRDQVLTLRAGERVSLPLGLGTMTLKDEVLKIRESPETGACLFYDPEERTCGIYAERPMQCRAQACWDTSDVQEVLRKGKKLARAHVVSPEEPVAPALVAHEAHCSVLGLAEAFEDATGGREDGMETILSALTYDAEIRPLLRDKLPLPEAELPFYFGRPLTQVVKQFGVHVVPDGDGYRLEPVTAADAPEEH